MSPQAARIEEPSEEAGASKASPEIDLDHLRRLLLGYDDERLERLQGWLNDPAYRAAEISSVLPRAIRLRPQDDIQLGAALAPSLETALDELIRRDPRAVSRALAPVILPAIREALLCKLAPYFRALRLALTVPGIRWLAEAWRSGESFNAVADRHTLRYRVEYVLLFHRATGSMLLEVENPRAGLLTPEDRDDAVVRMREMLAGTFDVSVPRPPRPSKLAVVMEQGPRLVLAAVVRGQEPSLLRDRMLAALDVIHLERRHSLRRAEVDAAAFASCRAVLEPLLESEYNDPSLRAAPLVGCVFLAGVLIVSLLVYLDVLRF